MITYNQTPSSDVWCAFFSKTEWIFIITNVKSFWAKQKKKFFFGVKQYTYFTICPSKKNAQVKLMTIYYSIFLNLL